MREVVLVQGFSSAREVSGLSEDKHRSSTRSSEVQLTAKKCYRERRTFENIEQPPGLGFSNHKNLPNHIFNTFELTLWFRSLFTCVKRSRKKIDW